MRLLLSLILVALLTVGEAAAQDDVAISARVVYPGVTMQLVGTQDALPLREGAVFPLRAGDTLRTDRQGRVLLTFGDALEILLLPISTLEITTSQTGESGYQLSARLAGQSIQRFADAPTQPLSLELVAGEVVINATDGWFGSWSFVENSSIVTVAVGEVEIASNGETMTLAAGDGARADLTTLEVTTFPSPLSAARLIGFTEGCEGTVRTPLDALNIRAGTSLGYAIIGYVNDGQPITLLGRTEDGNWYRVQRYSGFGWMLASAIDTDCTPPRYPNQYGEDNVEFFGIESIELELLAPFFGTPETNLWFFRSFAAE
jgi:hypothetical protein